MKTKYDIGDKVVLKAVVNGITVTNSGVMYQLTIFDGKDGWNSKVCIKESMLEVMNARDKGADNEND